MGNGFGLIVTEDGRYLWCEPDLAGNVSHRDILNRAKIWKNDNELIHHFVQVEFPGWKKEGFRFDEDSTLPGWVDKVVIRIKCEDILEKVYPIYANYEPIWVESNRKMHESMLAPDKEYSHFPSPDNYAKKIMAHALAYIGRVNDLARPWAEMVGKLVLIEGFCRED
jgi:hypothetical protein